MVRGMSLKAATARLEAHQSAMREGLMKAVLQLFDQIMALKGFRQVTVATSYLGARTYDVSEDRVIGYHAAHRDSLLEHLQEAVENGGGVVVRQFQAEKILV
jgi:hypothetical protein